MQVKIEKMVKNNCETAAVAVSQQHIYKEIGSKSEYSLNMLIMISCFWSRVTYVYKLRSTIISSVLIHYTYIYLVLRTSLRFEHSFLSRIISNIEAYATKSWLWSLHITPY